MCPIVYRLKQSTDLIPHCVQNKYHYFYYCYYYKMDITNPVLKLLYEVAGSYF